MCGDQMTLYNEVLEEFQAFQAELLGISVDGAWCHAAYARQNKLHFPLLADFEPKERSRALMVFTMKKKARANALYSSSIATELFTGAMSPRSVSIPEPMEFCPRPKSLRRKAKRPLQQNECANRTDAPDPNATISLVPLMDRLDCWNMATMSARFAVWHNRSSKRSSDN